MTKKDYEIVMNVFTCKNLDNRTISINLDNVDYWIGDTDPTVTEIHLKHTNYSLWIKVDEKTFRKNYIEYNKQKLNNE